MINDMIGHQFIGQPPQRFKDISLLVLVVDVFFFCRVVKLRQFVVKPVVHLLRSFV